VGAVSFFVLSKNRPFEQIAEDLRSVLVIVRLRPVIEPSPSKKGPKERKPTPRRMLDMIFQLLPWLDQKAMQNNAGTLDYPPLPLLAPSNLVEVRFSENLRKTSAKLFGEITVCYTE
jgi:hypothetical protein